MNENERCPDFNSCVEFDLDFDGKQVNRFVVNEGIVYCGCDNGDIYAFESNILDLNKFDSHKNCGLTLLASCGTRIFYMYVYDNVLYYSTSCCINTINLDVESEDYGKCGIVYKFNRGFGNGIITKIIIIDNVLLGMNEFKVILWDLGSVDNKYEICAINSNYSFTTLSTFNNYLVVGCINGSIIFYNFISGTYDYRSNGIDTYIFNVNMLREEYIYHSQITDIVQYDNEHLYVSNYYNIYKLKIQNGIIPRYLFKKINNNRRNNSCESYNSYINQHVFFYDVFTKKNCANGIETIKIIGNYLYIMTASGKIQRVNIYDKSKNYGKIYNVVHEPNEYSKGNNLVYSGNNIYSVINYSKEKIDIYGSVVTTSNVAIKLWDISTNIKKAFF